MACTLALIGIVAFHLLQLLDPLLETMTQSLADLQEFQQRPINNDTTNNLVFNSAQHIFVSSSSRRQSPGVELIDTTSSLRSSSNLIQVVETTRSLTPRQNPSPKTDKKKIRRKSTTELDIQQHLRFKTSVYQREQNNLRVVTRILTYENLISFDNLVAMGYSIKEQIDKMLIKLEQLEEIQDYQAKESGSSNKDSKFFKEWQESDKQGQGEDAQQIEEELANLQ